MRDGMAPEELAEKLGARGVAVEVRVPSNEDDIASIAQTGARIIVAGGDGTIHSVLKAAGACGLRLGIIPGGTANHLATSLGIPLDIDAAIDIVAAGRTRRIDLGIVNGTVFSQAAGAGLHARAFHIYGERREKSKVDGASAAVKAIVDWQPQLMRLIIDGEPYLEELTQVTAANTPDYGGIFTIAPDARIDDGLLDIVMLGKLTKLEIIEYANAARNGTIAGLPKTYTTRARKIEIATMRPEPVEVHADALPVGYTPATIEVMPGCVEVTAPEEHD